MPIYEYECNIGHRSEKLFSTYSDRTDSIPCTTCNYPADYRPSAPSFQFRGFGYIPIIDSAKEIWEDTPLAGTDGIDQANYTSTSTQVDLGQRGNRHGKGNEPDFPIRVRDPITGKVV